MGLSTRINIRTMGISFILPLLLIIAVFYFLIYLPQKQEQKKRKELLNKLQKGNRVITTSGIYGTIIKIDENKIVLRTGEKTEIVFDKSAVSRIIS